MIELYIRNILYLSLITNGTLGFKVAVSIRAIRNNFRVVEDLNYCSRIAFTFMATGLIINMQQAQALNYYIVLSLKNTIIYVFVSVFTSFCGFFVSNHLSHLVRENNEDVILGQMLYRELKGKKIENEAIIKDYKFNKRKSKLFRNPLRTQMVPVSGQNSDFVISSDVSHNMASMNRLSNLR